MKFKAWYSMEYQSDEGELECDADSEEDARKIFEEMAEDEALGSPSIDSITLNIECLSHDEVIPKKYIDPNQFDWVGGMIK